MSESMVRKQLYITPEQDRALKQQARERGVTEAAVVREALTQHLDAETPMTPEERKKAIEELLEANERIAKQSSFPEGYKFNREELYAEREERWIKNRNDE